MNKVIEKKQYLGNKEMETYRVDAQVEEIEAWAFAHCKKLKEIWIPVSLQKLDESAFLGCDALSFIFVYNSENEVARREAKLLALSMRYFENIEINYGQIGTEDWYRWYDKKLWDFVEADDSKGFEPFLAGGEEDYEDASNREDYYCIKRQQEKCKWILYRLETKAFLEKKDIQRCMEYVEKHISIFGDLLIDDSENAYDLLQVCVEYHMLDHNMIEELLNRLEGSVYAECRGLLLHYQSTLEMPNVWQGLQID